MVPTPAPSRRRGATLLVLALILLTAPFWIGQFDLDADRYTYERTEVGVEDGTISYVGPTTGPEPHLPISDDLGCEARGPNAVERICSFEHHLATSNATIRFGWSTTTIDMEPARGREHRYLLFPDGVYEQLERTANSTESASDLHGEFYPMYLEIEAVDPHVALHDVSVDASRSNVPNVVRRAAESGEASTRGGVDVPQDPIRVDGGTYYRVYESDVSDPPPLETAAYLFARFLAPVLGLGPLVTVGSNVRVTYVGDAEG